MAVKRIIDLVEDNTPSLDDYVAIDNSSPNTTRRTRVDDLLTAAATGVFLRPVDIGVTVQAYDADLTAIAALTSAADKVPYATGAGTWALADFSAAGRALVDDADAAAQRTTLGLTAASGASLIGWQQSGTGTYERTVSDALKERISGLDIVPESLRAGILDGTGTTNLTPYFETYLAARSWTVDASLRYGVVITLPAGRWKIDSSILMTGRNGLTIQGESRTTTIVDATSGDFPAFHDAGTVTTPTGRPCVRNMTIICGGKTGTQSYGIFFDGTNRGLISDVLVYRSKAAFVFKNNFESRMEGCDAWGGASDQCAIGLYMMEATIDGSGFYNNAVTITDCRFYDNTEYNMLVLNGRGSSFNNVKTGSAPINLQIGSDAAPPAAGVRSWLHFTNCLFDTATTNNIKILKDDAAALGDTYQLIFSGTWCGNAGAESVYMEGTDDVLFSGLEAVAGATGAVRSSGCRNLNVTGLLASQIPVGFPIVALADTTYSSLVNITHNEANTSVIESGTSDNNTIGLTSAAVTIVGASSKYFGAGGAEPLRMQNAGNVTAAFISPTTSTSYVALGIPSDIYRDRIERDSSGRITLYTAGGARFRVGQGTGASEFVNTHLQPDRAYGTTVASLPASPAGSRAYVTDSSVAMSGNFGAIVAGGGANVVPVFRDAANWRIG